MVKSFHLKNYVYGTCSLPYLTIIFALFLSENMTNPIRKLVGSMAKVKDGNFNILIDYEGNDEFSYLIRHNNMLKVKD